MIDPIISLAFSMHSTPGIYALLLGSGVSRAAGIPTGYEIISDLARKVAVLQEIDSSLDPLATYERMHGEAPSYSGLLEALAGTPAERNGLLRGYFEPTEQEVAEGTKVPTAAHRAIAELMAAGYIRAVITTNFDKLLEKALESAGLTPNVISTPDAAQGALPLVHAKCTVIKPNGDYLDLRTKNTKAELSEYDPRMASLLDQIFDQFGTVVCGWSGEWDHALRAAIERTPTRRFSTFWCVRGQPIDATKNLLALRAASVINIVDANSFFQDLREKVFSLRDLAREHPLSAALAVQTVKRYLPEPQSKIHLHDFVMEETEKVYRKCAEHTQFATPVSQQEFGRRIAHYESTSEILLAIMATGCFWGESHQNPLWIKSLQRLANPSAPTGGPFYEFWQYLSYYPSLLALYAGGIGAIAAKKYAVFAALLWKPIVRKGPGGSGTGLPLALLVNSDGILSRDEGQLLNPGQTLKTPVSDHLFSVLRSRFAELLPDGAEYERAFDEFEYLFSLVVFHHRAKNEEHPAWAPIGSYIWRDRYRPIHILDQVVEDAEQQGEEWPPLQAGLFDGSLETFGAVRQAFHSSDMYKRAAIGW